MTRRIADREVHDGEGVRVPLLWADGDERIRWITPRPARKPLPVIDGAPPDLSLHRLGPRTPAMVAAAIVADGQAEAHQARQQKIVSLSNAWRDRKHVRNFNAALTSTRGVC